jgi:hypothetical protein
MKLTILLSSAILFATALTPINAYADDQNLLCRRSGNECSSLRGNGNGKLSISGLDVNVKSSDRGNRDRNTRVSSNSNQNEVDNTLDAADIDNNTNNNDNSVDADNGTNTENNTDIVSDTGGGNNTNPPQLNSNDIKGFDPFGGLYGPGT